jgi:hypothetical protein
MRYHRAQLNSPEIPLHLYWTGAYVGKAVFSRLAVVRYRQVKSYRSPGSIPPQWRGKLNEIDESVVRLKASRNGDLLQSHTQV